MKAKYGIVHNLSPDEPLVIDDVGGDRGYMTVTNDIEAVVADLVNKGVLIPGRRLFYFDSEGNLDEIVVVGGEFSEFKPGPRPEDRKCRICGCTWRKACPDGCYWVGIDLCSSCAGKIKEGR